MPVNIPNVIYVEQLLLWQTVRDCVIGEPAIKKGGLSYLPSPSGKTPEQYARYANRVHFSGFTGRTAEGLFGNIFSKPPERTGDEPQLFSDFLSNVDKAGTGIEQFSADLCWDVMQTGWGGILVDHSPVPEGIRSPVDKERLGATSYLRRYVAENVINWKYDTINDQATLVLVVLKENYSEISVDEFTPKEKTRFRVLRLSQGAGQYEGQMIYTQQVYEKLPDKDEYIPYEPIIPILEYKPLNFIPFYTCPALEPEKSMLLDLAYENIGHYQKSADYENAIHYAGMPMACIFGAEAPVDKDGKPVDVFIGCEKVLFLPSTDKGTPSANYLEPSGAGMSQIRDAIASCEDRMAILGARIISAEKKGVETAEAARIHRAGENSVLGAFARNMSERITQAARLGARWRGVPEAITALWSFSLNLDYDGELGRGEEKKLGVTMVDNKLMSRLRFLKTYEEMSDDEARAEIELIDGESKVDFGTEGEDQFYHEKAMEGKYDN